MTPIRAQKVRAKSFREYLLDLQNQEGPVADAEVSDFVYASNGRTVPPDALVVPEYGPYDPVEKLHRIEDILKAYADELGWEHIELVEEE